jgi:hypothetical protein
VTSGSDRKIFEISKKSAFMDAIHVQMVARVTIAAGRNERPHKGNWHTKRDETI